MRKFLAFLLSAAVCTSLLTGCAEQQDTGSSTDSSAEEGKAFKVGLVQLMEHTSLNTIREAVLDEFKQLGYTDETLTVDYQNGLGEQTNLLSICQKFVGDDVDLIIAIATPAAQTAISVTEGTDIPVVFSAVTNPADVGIQNPEAPEGHATGTSDLIPVDSTLELARQIDPELETIGLLYNAGEANSISVIEEAKAFCDANNLKYEEKALTNISELQQAAQALVGNVDAVFTPIDNSIASAMAVLSQVCIDAKIPCYVGADSMVKDGGLAAVGIEYTELGRNTARMADQLLKGAEVSEVPVQYFEDFSKFINTTVAEKIELEIPAEILENAVTFE